MNIRNIPVIGYLGRMVWAILKLPKHIEMLYHCAGMQEEYQKELEEYQKKLGEYQKNILSDIDALQQKTSFAIEKNCSEEREHFLKNQKDIEELRSWNNDRLNEIRGLYELNVTEEYLKKLNYLLSAHSLVWGLEERLHISKLASVRSCRFNTNSGNIYIGDYTFAGSNVSILTGSHDKYLKGLTRRDAEYKNGYDINIGKGVWLASNSTVLGPCTIGDDAIVAAGAVVVPGTIIPAGVIYGGVPAKQIGTINGSGDDELQKRHLEEAVKRMDGILFLDGWSDRCEALVNGQIRVGYRLISESADILTDKNMCRFYFQKKTDGIGKIYLKTELGEKTEVLLEDTEGILDFQIEKEKEMLIRLTITADLNAEEIFLSAVK